jgi:two-component system, OmpR family, phosphate regulon sensor histidine kinase PhoR
MSKRLDLTFARRSWKALFTAIALLVLMQVAWWATVFVEEVGVVAALRKENLELSAAGTSQDLEKIAREAWRRRLMFLSESAFFLFLTGAGHFLLFRALRVEERSRETQKNFIEIVTHESKTPLTALKLRLEAARDEAPEAVRRDVSLALEEVRRLTSIFDKAMSLNRLERHAFTFELLRPADVVREVVRRLEPFFRERRVALSLDLDGEVLVSADPYGLQNTVQSLVENAVLYNEGGDRRVTIEVKDRGGKALIAVADNGPGVAEKDRARLFERFYRARSGGRVSGTGLGLYIARTVVEAHQGAIRLVDMVAPGARFEIELPRSGA